MNKITQDFDVSSDLIIDAWTQWSRQSFRPLSPLVDREAPAELAMG